MNNFFNRMSQRFRRFMVGRYGSDNLSRFMLGTAFACMIINLFFRGKSLFLSILIWALIILVYLRMFSKNIRARYNENTRYLMFKDRIRSFFQNRKNQGPKGSFRKSGPGNSQGSDSSHKIFRCPACGQRVRVPRGRGAIEISCPRCGNRFTKRS